MTPKELITKIQKKADTEPKMSHVTASDVSRVVSLLCVELSKLKTEEAFKTVSALIANGQKRRDKERSK